MQEELYLATRQMFDTYKNWLVKVECTIMSIAIFWRAERELVGGEVEHLTGEITRQYMSPRFPAMEDVMELIKPEIDHYVDAQRRHHEAKL